MCCNSQDHTQAPSVMCCSETHHQHEGCRCRDHGCECHHRSCTGDRGRRCDCFRRHHWTRAEKIVRLEAYLAELKAEAQAVEERLEELRR